MLQQNNEKLQNLIDDFMLTIEASGNVESDDTVKWNRQRINLFVAFLQEKQIDDPLTKRVFLQYAVYLKKRKRLDGRPGKLSVYYRRGCLQVLRRFGHWLYQEGHTTRDLGQVVSLPKIPKHAPPKAITPDDMEKILAICETIRDQALLAMLRDTGCRIGEIVGMRWQDVNLVDRRAFVTGKNKKSRTVFFTQEAADLLTRYRTTVPHNEEQAVWWGNLGKKNIGPFRYRGIHTLLGRLAKKAGVRGKWNPHAWRHAFGKRMNKVGVSTLNLQTMMGHSDPKTTLIYAGLDPDDLQQVYDEHM